MVSHIYRMYVFCLNKKWQRTVTTMNKQEFFHVKSLCYLFTKLLCFCSVTTSLGAKAYRHPTRVSPDRWLLRYRASQHQLPHESERNILQYTRWADLSCLYTLVNPKIDFPCTLFCVIICLCSCSLVVG